jgi:SAM-dependent methyltransferase
MKNADHWKPSKYLTRSGRLVPNPDPAELHPSSRLAAVLVASAYEAALPAHARGDALDLGCGKVPFYGTYRPSISSATCVDWGESAHGSIHVDHFFDLSKTIPLASASFDTIISSDVIEHLPDPRLAFQEMARLLRPGGRLILNTPFLYMLHEVPHDYFRLTRFSLSRLAQEAGLEVIELQELGGIIETWGNLTAKASHPLPLIGPLLSRSVQGLALAVARSRIGARINRKSDGRFPLGYFLVAGKPANAPMPDPGCDP